MSATAFKHKPLTWSYTFLGSIVFTAFMKLQSTHRQLMRLETRHIRDYFDSELVEFKKAPLKKMRAYTMCYFNAIGRVAKLSRSARQDYFALNRVGCFSASPDEQFEPKILPLLNKQTPLLIVPGLNTPPAFFREMYEFFSEKGYPVTVMTLPERGLADIETASIALEQEIQKLKTAYRTERVNVIGHCLGGLITQKMLENHAAETTNHGAVMPIKNFVTLGTGFLGADGVEILKEVWVANHPGKIVPKVFDELIQGTHTMVNNAESVICHNFLTIWDFMVHFRKGIMDQVSLDHEVNHIFNDPDIDHLTLALNPKVFARIEQAITSS